MSSIPFDLQELVLTFHQNSYEEDGDFEEIIDNWKIKLSDDAKKQMIYFLRQILDDDDNIEYMARYLGGMNVDFLFCSQESGKVFFKFILDVLSQ